MNRVGKKDCRYMDGNQLYSVVLPWALMMSDPVITVYDAQVRAKHPVLHSIRKHRKYDANSL